jgi:pimeloyl-ACP methyl ester carboxylesterase
MVSVCRDWGGSGPPVVLLHGLAGHSGEWDLVAEALSARFRVVAAVAVSIPGTGHDLHLERPEALLAVLSDFLGGW